MDQKAYNLDVIIKDLNTSNQDEVLEILASQLVKKGLVKESFMSAVIERENNFPTGLELEKTNVALPHADPEHVLTDSIAIATIKDTAEFSLMTDLDYKVDVKIVFMLALKEGEAHLNVLRNLIEFIQNEKNLKMVVEGDEEFIRDGIAKFLSS